MVVRYKSIDFLGVPPKIYARRNPCINQKDYALRKDVELLFNEGKTYAEIADELGRRWSNDT